MVHCILWSGCVSRLRIAISQCRQQSTDKLKKDTNLIPYPSIKLTMEINYPQIIGGILSGSVAASLINKYLDNRKNRKQRIGFESQLATVYQAFDKGNVSSQISITWQDKEYRFKNLMVARVEFQNKGNQDYPEFDFGLIPTKNIKIIQVTKLLTDRYHHVELIEEPSFETPKDQVDLVLRPFNRKESYVLEILCASDNEIGTWEFKPKTTKPINITEIESAVKGTKFIGTTSKFYVAIFAAFFVGYTVSIFAQLSSEPSKTEPAKIQVPTSPSDSILNKLEKIKAERNESGPGV